jgi:D-alanyl-D-alanine carboxypeptidase
MKITGTYRNRSASFVRGGSVAVVCAALIATSVTAAVAGPVRPGPTSAAAGTSRSALDKAARDVVAAGAVGYMAQVRDGERIITTRAGLADRRTRRPIGTDDQFEIGSNTKTFVATLILQMVARGQLSLEDSIDTYLPGLVPGGDKITVRRILNHTSGIFNYTDDEPFMSSIEAGSKRVWTPKELVRIAVTHGPDFAPGKGWNYSNTNYILAGMITEKVSGQSLAYLVEHRITRPLGLKRTYLIKDRVKYTGPGFAHGYLVHFTSVPKTTYTDVSRTRIGGWGGGAGAMVSTPSELATFFSALLGGQLLPATQLAQMQQTVPMSTKNSENGYGLGLMKRQTACGPMWGHGGDTLGHHSTAMVSDDGRRVAITDLSTQGATEESTPTGEERGEKFGAAAAVAENTANCLMLGKPVPAEAAAH